MKRCSTCNEPKHLGDFHKDSNRQDGRTRRCKVCTSKYVSEYHKKNRKRRLKLIAISKGKRRAFIIKCFVKYMEDKKCLDCGIEDIEVLEFDHVKEEKERSISALIGNASRWEIILREIKKCEIVCANCHRKRTCRRGRWAKVYGLKAPVA